MTKKILLLFALLTSSLLGCKSTAPSLSNPPPAHQYQGPPPSLTPLIPNQIKAWEVHTYAPPGWMPIDPKKVDAPEEMKYAFVNPKRNGFIFFSLFPFQSKDVFKRGITSVYGAFRTKEVNISPLIEDQSRGSYLFTFTGTSAMQRAGKILIRHPVGQSNLFLFIAGFWPTSDNQEMSLGFDVLEKSITLKEKEK